MKNIDLTLINKQYADYQAIFMTELGIVVHLPSSSPLLPLGNTVKSLQLAPTKAYLDDNILLVQCHTGLSLEKMSQMGYALGNPKTHLAAITDQPLQNIVIRSVQWLAWDNHCLYCSHCGLMLTLVLDTKEKRCSKCQQTFYPNLSPAVMVLIQREQEILLARSTHFRPHLYSVIAGFIEVGETAEMAAHREVMEEVGVSVSDLQYFGTQSWPFPDSFIIAFTAKYVSGDIKVDGIEIEDARWFSIQNLPELPSQASISRRLIDSILLRG